MNEYAKRAFSKLIKSIVYDIYEEAFSRVQSLGNPGKHTDNFINRADALDALKAARDAVLADVDD